MNDIKAIETRYKGHRFRSRLEARWAVFFDSLSMPYEYEKEGFVLPSGNYLPDFYLPDDRLWVEIKGQRPREKELLIAKELAIATKRHVFVFYGVPTANQGIGFVIDLDLYEEPEDSELIEVCRWDDVFMQKICSKAGYFAKHGVAFVTDTCLDPFGQEVIFDTIDTSVIRAAGAAKSARFEFGESG